MTEPTDDEPAGLPWPERNEVDEPVDYSPPEPTDADTDAAHEWEMAAYDPTGRAVRMNHPARQALIAAIATARQEGERGGAKAERARVRGIVSELMQQAGGLADWPPDAEEAADAYYWAGNKMHNLLAELDATEDQ